MHCQNETLQIKCELLHGATARGHKCKFVTQKCDQVIVVHVHLFSHLSEVRLSSGGSCRTILHVHLEAGQVSAEFFVHTELLRTYRTHAETNHLRHLLLMVG